MVYIRVSGRAIVNIHSANAEGSVGNYMGLTKMFIVRRTQDGYNIVEDVVISGNMLKHWHAVRVVERLRDLKYKKLCKYCSRFVMYRSTLGFKDEYEFINACAIEDLHGFLQPDTQVRRESLVKFAFMIPIEEMRAEYASVTHNRVVVTEKGNIPAREQAMMVFKREYASGIYGFLCTMDLAYVGRPLADPLNPNKTLPLDDRKIRAKQAILALSDILTGRFGAAASRAIPTIKTEEFLGVISKQAIPNLIHGFYKDYIEESGRILKNIIENKGIENIKVYVSGNKPIAIMKKILPGEALEVCNSPLEALAKMAKVSETWLT